MINYRYKLKRSKRKTISIEISREAEIVVRAPLRMKINDIEAFLLSKREWINIHLSKMQKRLADAGDKFTEEEIVSLKTNAKNIIVPRVEFFAREMGVEYGRIAVRIQKTRFGSCSSKNNLNFNAVIALMPPEIMDYVIVHELSHLKQMNHSAEFWREVERVIPEYKIHRAWLKENGIKFIQKL